MFFSIYDKQKKGLRPFKLFLYFQIFSHRYHAAEDPQDDTEQDLDAEDF